MSLGWSIWMHKCSHVQVEVQKTMRSELSAQSSLSSGRRLSSTSLVRQLEEQTLFVLVRLLVVDEKVHVFSRCVRYGSEAEPQERGAAARDLQHGVARREPRRRARAQQDRLRLIPRVRVRNLFLRRLPARQRERVRLGDRRQRERHVHDPRADELVRLDVHEVHEHAAARALQLRGAERELDAVERARHELEDVRGAELHLARALERREAPHVARAAGRPRGAVAADHELARDALAQHGVDVQAELRLDANLPHLMDPGVVLVLVQHDVELLERRVVAHAALERNDLRAAADAAAATVHRHARVQAHEERPARTLQPAAPDRPGRVREAQHAVADHRPGLQLQLEQRDRRHAATGHAEPPKTQRHVELVVAVQHDLVVVVDHFLLDRLLLLRRALGAVRERQRLPVERPLGVAAHDVDVEQRGLRGPRRQHELEPEALVVRVRVPERQLKEEQRRKVWPERHGRRRVVAEQRVHERLLLPVAVVRQHAQQLVLVVHEALQRRRRGRLLGLREPRLLLPLRLGHGAHELLLRCRRCGRLLLHVLLVVGEPLQLARVHVVVQARGGARSRPEVPASVVGARERVGAVGEQAEPELHEHLEELDAQQLVALPARAGGAVRRVVSVQELGDDSERDDPARVRVQRRAPKLELDRADLRVRVEAVRAVRGEASAVPVLAGCSVDGVVLGTDALCAADSVATGGSDTLVAAAGARAPAFGASRSEDDRDTGACAFPLLLFTGGLRDDVRLIGA
ncbi:hypothetical protein PybrP1_004134 [[Pythium] brassicae (nom. inval.)]|nr:hypothetical protein PybrP1_004134 [[Pythium] brassicae (nom. inval.)]